MGRELRRVPADWKHPLARSGVDVWGDKYRPLFASTDVWKKLLVWMLEYQQYEKGVHPDQKKIEECCYAFSDWDGGPPDPSDYMPNWPKSERTHYQWYESTSEGTPISPVCESREELARWLSTNEGGSYEEWLRCL